MEEKGLEVRQNMKFLETSRVMVITKGMEIGKNVNRGKKVKDRNRTVTSSTSKG